MKKINWKQKLSSRKAWAAFAGVVAPILVLLNVPTETIVQIVAIIGSIGTLVIYILVEGNIDAKRVTCSNEVKSDV